MPRIAVLALVVLQLASAVDAQWLNHPSPAIPRSAGWQAESVGARSESAGWKA